MNRWVAKNLVYFPVQYVRGLRVKRYLRDIKANECKTLKEIHKLQDEKLKRLLKFAYLNNRFYRNRFDAANIGPQDIVTGHSLSKIPILSKRELLESGNEISSARLKERVYIHQTGGSTGMTLHLAKEASAMALRHAIMIRCYNWYNIDIGDRQVRFWGVPVTLKQRINRRLKDLTLNRIRISAFDISEEACEEQLRRINEFRPAYIYGYTTAIYGFCYFMKKRGIRLDHLNLKAVICTAEKMFSHHRNLFEEMFSCPIVNEYGCAEHGIVAFQCKHGNMHIMSDHLLVEILNNSGEPVAAGEPGRIVLTDLDSYAMPLIRYEIGDIGSPSDERCSCGVSLPVMDVVEGREEDFIKTKQGQLIHTAYLCYTLKDNAVREFRMYQRSLDYFFVQIVKSHSFDYASEDMLAKKPRTMLGNDVKIEFEYLEKIPRERSGKLRYFVSEF